MEIILCYFVSENKMKKNSLSRFVHKLLYIGWEMKIAKIVSFVYEDSRFHSPHSWVEEIKNINFCLFISPKKGSLILFSIYIKVYVQNLVLVSFNYGYRHRTLHCCCCWLHYTQFAEQPRPNNTMHTQLFISSENGIVFFIIFIKSFLCKELSA